MIDMKVKQLVLLFLLVLTAACVRGPKQLDYTPKEFRAAVMERLGHQLKGIKPISISNLNGVRQLVTPRSVLVPPFEISPETAASLEHCIPSGLSQRERFNFLYNCLLSGPKRFKYATGTTISADSCFRNRQGNCFSMTNLLVGAARYAGLDACYVLVEDIIGNREQGKVIIHTNHIVTGIQIGAERRLIDFLPGKTHYHYLTMLSDIEAAGLYYNNLGAGLLTLDREADAKTLLNVALKLYPDSYQIQNNSGVVLLREGDLAGAKKHFLRALKTARFPDLVMGNIMKTFKRTGKMEVFQRLRSQMERAKKRNPYFYIDLAEMAFRKKEYQIALRYTRIARRIDRTIPEIYEVGFQSYGMLKMEKKKAKAYKKLLKYSHFDKEAPPMPEIGPAPEDVPKAGGK